VRLQLGQAPRAAARARMPPNGCAAGGSSLRRRQERHFRRRGPAVARSSKGREGLGAVQVERHQGLGDQRGVGIGGNKIVDIMGRIKPEAKAIGLKLPVITPSKCTFSFLRTFSGLSHFRTCFHCISCHV
jgi:hypothetical protein